MLKLRLMSLLPDEIRMAADCLNFCAISKPEQILFETEFDVSGVQLLLR